MIELRYIDPREDPVGRATLVFTYSESYVEELIVKEIGKALGQLNRLAALSHLMPRLQRREELVAVNRELKRFVWRLKRDGNLEVVAEEPRHEALSPREFRWTFQFRFRARTSAICPLIPASAPSWALSGRQDPEGGSEY